MIAVGAPDVVAGAGPGGGPFVRVYSGATGAELRSFSAFDAQFRGGVNVAAGDVNGDGFKDVIVGADAGGGPVVRVFSGADGAVLSEFLALPAGFTGGIQVAAADFDRDGDAEIVVGTQAGGVPLVRVFDRQGNVFSASSLPGFVNTFFAFTPAFTGGVYVAAGDVTGDGVADVVVGAGAGGGPHVRVFDGVDGSDAGQFYAYEAGFAGGVRVAVGDVNGDGLYEVKTAPGPGRVVEVRGFTGTARTAVENVAPFSGFTGGAYLYGTRIYGVGWEWRGREFSAVGCWRWRCYLGG